MQAAAQFLKIIDHREIALDELIGALAQLRITGAPGYQGTGSRVTGPLKTT